MLEIHIRGFTVRATFSFFAVVGLAASLGGAEQTQLLTVLLCSLLHELGHILAMCFFGIYPGSLTFCAGGIKLPGRGLERSGSREWVILSAGPTVNLISAGISLAVGYRGTFAAANLALGLFNLLPFRTFDGGRIYSCLTGSEPPKPLCILAAVPLTALAGYSFIRGNIPVSLIAAAFFIIDGS